MKTRAYKSVAAAARAAARRKSVGPSFYSVFKTDFHTSDGTVEGIWRHNLTTTTATGYTNAYDWLAKAMGQGPSFAFASAQGTATATSGTSMTNSGATFPTSGQGLAGSIVVVGANASGTGSVVYGVILTNTSTVLTVDQWYSGTSTTGAVGTTPNATGQYIILPGQNPASQLSVTSSATTVTTADNFLASELTTNGFSRAVGSFSHTAAANTFALSHLWTATGSQTINNEAVSGAATWSSSTPYGGVYPFASAEPNAPSLVSGDSLTNTVTITI